MTRRNNPRAGVRFADGLVVLLVVALGAIWYVGRSGPDSPPATIATPLEVGDRAPEVALPATTGSVMDLAQLREKQHVLLYFYEHPG